MFLTRDFVLVLVMVVFLVMAIGATIFGKADSTAPAAQTVAFVESPAADYEVVSAEKEGISREQRLAEMRKKVAESGELLTLSAPDTAPTTPVVPVEETPVVTVAPAVVAEQRCADYGSFTGSWSPAGLQFEVAEGARLVYREVMKDVITGTTSRVQQTREVLLQLPMRALPSSQPSCLTSDVVGVAQDGSLIRNAEAGLYGVFGESTLIGYALDGFPIYGNATVATDVCGGAVLNGTYRYYLSAERDFILGCYAATPVTL